MKNLTRAVVFAAVFAAVFFVADSVSAATMQFHLRHQNTVFFEGETDFPVAGFVTATDSDGVGHDLNSQSVLNLLLNIDSESEEFSISTLQYFSSFSAFYVKCIEIPVKSVTACDNWQYVVDGTYPSVGMDNYVLSGGENVWIYFGDVRQAFLAQGSQKTDNSFSLTSEQYQYEINGWAPVTGYTIGIKKDGVVVATKSVDNTGDATFTVSEPGNYTAGLVEDFYFPSTAFYVDQYVPSFGPSGSAAPPPFENPEPAGEGLPKQSSPEKVFDVKAAVGFLQSLQGEDGSISSAPFLNDWLALAIPGNEQLKAYLLSDPNPGDLLTDYERRAMALHALGINPYSGTPTNYIAKILEGFDGTQFGNQDLANDDIFALIPLSKAGYTLADPEVEKTVSFILSWQQSNGSWSDVDSTAAAVQALLFAKDRLEVQVALDRAKLYLISQKQEDNSFGNAYSTSWALQALKALGENVSSSGLADLQAEDGGLLKDDSLNNRIWATAYAIPAAEGKSWSSILQSFEKPQVVAEPEVTTAETPEAALLSIQVEVEKIGLAVAALEPQVALLYNQHLARLAQERVIASIAQEVARVSEEARPLAQANALVEAEPQEEVEFQISAVAEERSSTSAQVASVESAFPASNGLGAKQIVLLIVAASAIFLLAGGTNLVSPLLRKLAMRV